MQIKVVTTSNSSVLKKLILLFISLVTLSCSENHDTDKHLTFGGISISGTADEFLDVLIKQGNQRLSGDSFEKLELQITEVSRNSFKCSYHGAEKSADILWFEVFPGVDENNNSVCSLEARSIINQNVYQNLLSNIKDAFGRPSYTKNTYTADFINSLDDVDPLAYLEPEGEFFYIWVIKNGYVIIEDVETLDSGLKYIIMYIVDENNFKQYLLSQMK